MGLVRRQEVDVETLRLNTEGAGLFAEIAAPPMNLLGPELVRDLVSLIRLAEVDNSLKVVVFKMTRGLQTRDAEMKLAELIGDL